MDPEVTSQTITDEKSVRTEKTKRVANIIAFIITFAGHVIPIVFGVPMLEHCFNVALIVMIIGSVTGFIQQVPEFLRNFIKLKPERRRHVNYFYSFIIVLRIIWLVTATVVVATSDCHDIIHAWICVYVNWGVLLMIVIIILIVIIVRSLKGRKDKF